MPEGARNTYQQKLKLTPAQERQLEQTLWRCRVLYHTTHDQRISVWRQRGVSLTRYRQESAWKAVRADLPDYAALHSHVWHEVLARRDTT
jgi:putative transposase